MVEVIELVEFVEFLGVVDEVLLQYQSKSYYIIGRRFITVSGVFIRPTLSGTYYIIGRFLLHYRARITVSGVYYIIGWYSTRLQVEQNVGCRVDKSP